jgi:hypothetical protein
MNRAASNSTRLFGFANARPRRGARPTRGAASLVAILGTISTTLLVASNTAFGQATQPAPATSNGETAAKSELPNAALFSTGGNRAAIGPLDSVIYAALEQLNVVNVSGRPGMDLNGVQLAIDCVGETTQCLRSVANQTSAQILIAPSLQTTPSELVLSLLRFDASDGQMRRVLRRQPGTSLRPETLDAVPSMLRELFELPEPKPQPTTPAADITETEPERAPLPPIIEPPQEPAASRPMPVGPWLLAGGGALVLGGGAVVGVMMLNTNDEYNSKRTRDQSDVSDAIDLRDKAKTQAVIANVLFGVGGAMAVAGGIWLAVALSQPYHRDDWQTSVIPAIGPGQLGLTLVHRGGAL